MGNNLLGKNATNMNILNLIRANMGDIYQERIPEATLDNIADIGEAILSYEPFYNSFNQELINRIGLSYITRRDRFDNPLRSLKHGMIPFGTDVEEIYVGVAQAKVFDPEGSVDTVFKREKGLVKTAFHRQNRQEFYKVTISRAELKGAFISEYGLSDLIAKKMDSLYEGDSLDEFLLMKKIIGNHYTNGYFTPVVVPKVADMETAKQFTATLREYSSNLTFLKNTYNPLGLLTRTARADQVILISPKIEAMLDVEVLAMSFNMSKAELLGNIIVVDDFGLSGSQYENIQAVMMDRELYAVWDTLYETGSIYNPEGLYWNNTLHHWQILSTSMFANGVVFTTEPTPTAVVVNPTSVSIAQGASYTFKATVTGDSSNTVEWSITGNTSVDTVINSVGELTIGADETTGTDNITVTAKSVFKDTVSGTAKVSVTAKV